MKTTVDITPHTNVKQLLDNYPELEDKLIEIAPVFVKLKNPVLRRTVARVTDLKQASTIANIPVGELINKLRKFAGMQEILLKDEKSNLDAAPDWVSSNSVKIAYDASADLDAGKHPVAKVSSEILTLTENDSYKLTTPFIPVPLIKIIEDKGFETFTEKENENLFHTYIRINSSN